MTDAELTAIIFHTDYGSCFRVLRRRLMGDTDIFNTSPEFTHPNRKHAERIIKEARKEGYLEGKADWLKVTKKGWDFNRNPSESPPSGTRSETHEHE